jgi:hypothetical protein
MKNLLPLIVTVAALLLSCNNKPITLEERLATIDIIEIDTLAPDTQVFKEAYEIHLMQPLDHNNPGGDKFSQKIYLSFAGPDKPVVVVTEGYSAGRNYTAELAAYLDCNQIIVEHRFFGESVPEDKDWKYMNTFQAASDHHRIIELFSKVFTGKWITTGISKGGQTVMYHSYYYPDDADIRVPYVAPLNFGPEDPRIYTFLDTVGSDPCREKVYSAQVNILKNRDIYYPMMLDLAEKQGLTFEKIGGPERAFEFSVLEYDFAFFQWWGRVDCEDILLEGDPVEVFNQFFSISGPDYFSDSGSKAYEPFFYQALTEIGYYGYRFDKFGDLLQYAEDSQLPEFTFALPEDEETEYNYELMKKVDTYVRTADNFIYIYGMKDTWSATAASVSEGSNSLKILKKDGGHTTRIKNLPADQRELVLSTLKKWLTEN